MTDRYAHLVERFGHLVDPTKDVHAAIAATGLKKWKAEKVLAAVRKRPPADDTDTAHVAERGYIYDKTGDRYIFILRTEKEPRVIDGATLRAMKRAYSDHDGAPQPVEAVARKFRLRREVFNEIKQRLGWTHGSIPFTDEEVDGRDHDELASEARTLRAEGIYHRLKAEEWEDVRRDATRWRRLEHALTEVAERFDNAPARTVEPLLLPQAEHRFAMVLPIQDLHVGQISEVEAFGFDVVRDRLRTLTGELVARLPGRPDCIYLTVGGDWFNVDGGRMQTTKGTPQHGHATPSQVFETGLDLIIEQVDAMRQVAPVVLVYTPGNHDAVYSHAAWVVLRRLYAGVDGVRLLNPESKSPRQYDAYGRTMLMFYHGHGPRQKNLGALAANEARDLWGRTDWTEAFSGHWHSPVTRDVGGLTLNVVPSATVESEWEHLTGFEPARRGLMAYVVEHDLPGVTMSVLAPLRIQHGR